jgi:hypothetical protein
MQPLLLLPPQMCQALPLSLLLVPAGLVGVLGWLVLPPPLLLLLLVVLPVGL